MDGVVAPLRPLGSYQAYLLDVDGTLVYPRRAVPGAREAVLSLRRANARLLIVTNNSLLSRAEMAARLHTFGFPVSEKEIATAILATAKFIGHERPGARVLALGSDGLRGKLLREGLRLVEDGRLAEYLVVGCDLDVTYERLTQAMRAANTGARFVAVNQDRIIPDDEGGFPGSALFVGAVQGASGREPDVVIGKPSTLLLEQALELIGLPASECLFVGDSLTTDVRVARAVGMPCLLVLTGVTGTDVLASSDIQPDYVLESLADIIPHVEREHRARVQDRQTAAIAPSIELK